MQYFNKQPNKGIPRLNEVLTPKACQALLTYTLSLEDPYSVQPFFVFMMNGSLVKSVIGHTITPILRWLRHGNSLSNRVNAGTALYSPPGLVWVYLHTQLPLIISLGDSLLQRLNAA